MKDFDKWNKIKKDIDNKGIHKWCRERDVWWYSLGENIGYEQNGKDKNYSRPVLVLKIFSKSICLIVPLTTSTKINKYHIKINNINNQNSVVIFSQIRLIDTKRLEEKITKVNKEDFLKIKNSIHFNFFE